MPELNKQTMQEWLATDKKKAKWVGALTGDGGPKIVFEPLVTRDEPYHNTIATRHDMSPTSAGVFGHYPHRNVVFVDFGSPSLKIKEKEALKQVEIKDEIFRVIRESGRSPKLT
ncbi:hypothetical protein ACFL2C_01975 [Patescibacteria group bacterium]